MGDPSYLRLVSGEAIPINWSAMPEASKDLVKEYCKYTKAGGLRKRITLPPTVGHLAKMLHETKFFGYMTPELWTLLMDISEFGLAGSPIPPRFYMKQLSQVQFVLFSPGDRKCITGGKESPVGYENDEDAEKAFAAEYDIRLEAAVKRGEKMLVPVTQKLAGWEASDAKKSLEYAQFADAIMTLPDGHPAQNALLRSVFGSFR